MARVVLENLHKTFTGPKGAPVPAVVGLNLVVEDQELLAVVGPSGCGKTTLLRLIAGLEDPDAGDLTIDRVAMNRVAPKDRHVAMVFQSHALYPHLTVRENLASGLVWRNSLRAEIDQRVREVSALLSLEDCLNRRPEHISGGQRQRVALGRALVRKPRLFLLDEPLASLDAPMRAQMRRELKTLQRRLGITMIYVTHDQAEALTLGDRIAVMRDGGIEQCADARTLYQQPAKQFVAGFIGSPAMNFFGGTIVQQAGRLCFRELNAAGDEGPLVAALNEEWAAKLAPNEGQAVVLGLRPEHLRLAADAEHHSELRVTGAIELVEMLGAETHLHLRRGRCGLVVRLSGIATATVGQSVSVTFQWHDARFFDAATSAAVG